ncbi:hypothetical protein L596_006979 [Steinernema carpocapsae]|uniref:Uncharacterized protein n=1 Tax=Steinernema carpocapsae TaxID=34508 RepID=A0A4U5P7T3_STECR|nr:hypothetical protein L596_006979 [Steinernema carpocapsae]
MLRQVVLGEYLFSTVLAVITTGTLILTFKNFRYETAKNDAFFKVLLVAAFFFALSLLVDGVLWSEFCISDDPTRSNYLFIVTAFILYSSFSLYDACSIIVLIHRNCSLHFPVKDLRWALKIAFMLLFLLILAGVNAMIVLMLFTEGDQIPTVFWLLRHQLHQPQIGERQLPRVDLPDRQGLHLFALHHIWSRLPRFRLRQKTQA